MAIFANCGGRSARSIFKEQVPCVQGRGSSSFMPGNGRGACDGSHFPFIKVLVRGHHGTGASRRLVFVIGMSLIEKIDVTKLDLKSVVEVISNRVLAEHHARNSMDGLRGIVRPTLE